jgi:hypothetical protein
MQHALVQGLQSWVKLLLLLLLLPCPLLHLACCARCAAVCCAVQSKQQHCSLAVNLLPLLPLLLPLLLLALCLHVCCSQALQQQGSSRRTALLHLTQQWMLQLDAAQAGGVTHLGMWRH